jgi:hypothetical protein
MPTVGLPIATPIPHPIATPKHIQTAMNFLSSFLLGESLIESFYFEIERPLLAEPGRSAEHNRLPRPKNHRVSRQTASDRGFNW